MDTGLPASLYKPESGRRAARVVRVVAATVIALLAGWQVLNLPGALIKRNEAPPDLTGKAYGIHDIFVEADGKWTIQREGYLDRMRTYVISPKGTLRRQQEKLDKFEGDDVSGVSHGSNKVMLGGSLLDVKASKRFYDDLRELRPEDAQPRTTGGGEAADETERPAGGEGGAPQFTPPGYHDDQPATDDTVAETEEVVAVRVETYYQQKRQNHRITEILPGHFYYPSLDSYAYDDPYLWLTSSGQSYLNVLHVTDREGPPVFTALAQIELSTRQRLQRDCTVGFDPRREQLFIVLANGNRLWFDPLELAQQGEDQLPGVWRSEYATLSLASRQYVHEQGLPLSEAAYRRLMGMLMVVFLASLLILANEGRKSWKFTAVATTADSSSSTESSSTSPNSDTPA